MSRFQASRARLFCIGVVLAQLAVCAVAADPVASLDGALELRLGEATVRGTGESALRPAVTLSLLFHKGKLLPGPKVDAPGYNSGAVTGDINIGKVEGGRIQMHLSLKIDKDPWIPGGAGEYDLNVRVVDGIVEGSYAGQFQQRDSKQQEVRGGISGMLVPYWPDLAEKVTFEGGEHPRLLLRKADIATLRERAQTPQGKLIVANLERLLAQADRGFAWNRCSTRTPPDKRCATLYSEGYYLLGEALMYLLTDKPQHLERARFRMLDAMTSRDGEAGGWGNAPRMTGVALAYDLLYNDLDQDFRRTIQGYLAQPSPELSWPISTGGNYQMMFAAAETMCDLAVLGDPVRQPNKPPSADDALMIEPLVADAIGRGVPVQAFRSGQMPSELLVLGTFENSDDSPLDGIGGPEELIPSLDTQIKYGGAVHKPHLLKESRNRLSYGHNYKGHPPIGLDLRLWGGGKHKTTPQTIYAYAVINVESSLSVIARPDMPDVSVGNRIWINGRPVAQGDVVRLKKGKYGLLLAVPARGLFAAPNLQRYNEQKARKEYEKDLARWKAEGGTMAGASRRLLKHRAYLQRALSVAMGDRGYLWEQYGITDMRSELLLTANAYENLFEQPFAPESGLKWTLPLNIHYNHQYWGCDWGGAFWPAYAFAHTTPEEYRPAIRWWIDQELSRMDPKVYSGMMTQPNHALYLLLNYPWDVKPAPPAKWTFPLAYVDRSKGLYLFRSGWDPEKDLCVSVILQKGSFPSSVYAGTSIISNWNRGRLIGYQHLGAGFYLDPQPGQGFYEKGAQLKIGDLQPKGGARVTSFASRPDGSATLSLTIDRWVKAKKSKHVAQAKPIDGVALKRAVGVDYSGASGAKAVIVYVDRVEGAGGRDVQFRLPITSKRWRIVQKEMKQTIDLLEYDRMKRTAAKNGMNMRITHVVPAPARLHFRKKGTDTQIWTEGANERFVVVTVYTGQAPDVAVEGTGLDASVHIGKQTIRFDDGKIVFGSWANADKSLR